MAKTKGIYKRGNKYWIRYAGLDGTIARESSGSTKLKDAEALLLDRKQAIKEGVQPEVKKIANHLFKELADAYIAWARRQRCFKTKIYLINQLVVRFGNLPLRRFSTLLAEQYQTERLENGNKPATVNRLLATIKHMFTKAADWNMVEENVLKGIRKVKLLQENNRRLRYLSEEECDRLLNSCDNHLRPIVLTALHTGMRKAEILGLRWDQVDLNHGYILLDITKNGERRELPINEILREMFQNQMRRLDVPFVFYDPSTGQAYLDVKRSFSSACGRAGVKDFHFHDLRHTFASHMAMAGIDLTTIKELLGHKTLSMTLRYAHLAPSHKAKAVDVLAQRLGQKATAQKLHNLDLVQNG